MCNFGLKKFKKCVCIYLRKKQMNRNVIKKLVEWKNNNDRKPLILKGARQVGKTWIMNEFGKRYYTNFVYFNFDENEDIKSIFQTNKDPFRIIDLLSMISNIQIEQNKTLIIFDEIQECPEALNSLKYFNEKANNYNIIAAGSLLGTLLSSPKSFPVGKVDIINLYPLSFDEFLQATDSQLYNYYCTINAQSIIEEYFHNKLLEKYNEYLIVGGMPECVASWLKYKDSSKILKIQKDLLEIYKNDFSKYNGKINAGRLLMVFISVPNQLAKENEKFIYGVVKQGGRARDFEEAIQYLVESGLLYKIDNVSKIEHPLKAFDKYDQFKLFFFDIGLLKCHVGLSNEAIILKSDYQFKGPFTENYVL